jgi:arginine N-succinyltransferase
MGLPHPSGRAALRMLEGEGFRYDRYIDIFDGGPTVTAPTDQIRTVRESNTLRVAEIGEGGAVKMMLAAGALKQFRAGMGEVQRIGADDIAISEATARLLDLQVGDEVLAVGR